MYRISVEDTSSASHSITLKLHYSKHIYISYYIHQNEVRTPLEQQLHSIYSVFYSLCACAAVSSTGAESVGRVSETDVHSAAC